MKESELYNSLKKEIKKYYSNVILQRIESGGTAAGIPDIFYRTKYQEGWIELKQVSFTKKLALIKFRPGQIGWMKKYIDLGGRVYIFATPKNEEGLYIFKPRAIPEGTMSKEAFLYSCIYYTTERINWLEVINILNE